MPATVAQLGERALRRLGVAVVAVADRPAQAAPVPPETIATRALMLLGVIAADEAPPTLDQALALEKVRAVHDQLVGQGFVSWAIDAIPLAASEEMIRLTAMHLAPAFGKVADPVQQDVVETRIRRVSVVMGAPDLAAQAVLAVHMDLDARGKARWSVFDIWEAAEQPYVVLAANILAPEFGLPVDDRGELMARTRLAQLIALPTDGETFATEYF